MRPRPGDIVLLVVKYERLDRHDIAAGDDLARQVDD
jgi:hypothetical protein